MLCLYSCDCFFGAERDAPHTDGAFALKLRISIHGNIINRAKALAQSALNTLFLIYS